MKNNYLDLLIIVIILSLILFFINPFFSYILLLSYYILSVKRNLIVIFLLILNIGMISIFKLPNSDHYRYYRFFYDIAILDKKEFIYFLKQQEDFIFHISMYFYNKYLNYRFWISNITIISFLLVIFSLKKYEKILGKKCIILLFDPFNIKRWTIGMTFYLFGDKYKKINIFKLFGIFTHISILILPISKFLSKFIPKKFLYIQKIILVINIFILGIIFCNIFSASLKLIGVNEYYLVRKPDSLFTTGNWKGIIFNIYSVYLDYLIFFSIYFSKKLINIKEKKIEIILVFILIISMCINFVMARRILQIFLIFYIYNYFEKIIKTNVKKIILLMLISKFLLFLIINIKYGYETKSYPFLSKISHEKIMSNNKNEAYRNIFIIYKEKK